MGRNLGPLQTANVRLAIKDDKGQPEVVFVGRGEALPDNLADGELERLEKAGAFSLPPKPVNMTVPEAAVELTNWLPPQVILAANDEDGNVVAGTPAAVGAIASPPDFLVEPAKAGDETVKEPAKPRSGQR